MTTTPEPVQTAAGEYVLRVSDLETGHHYTIVADTYDSKRHRLLKSPALDSYGYPAAPKFKTATAGAETDDDTDWWRALTGSDETDDDTDDERYTGSDETQQEAQ